MDGAQLGKSTREANLTGQTPGGHTGSKSQGNVSLTVSLVSRPSPLPVFDNFQYKDMEEEVPE